MPLRKPSVYEGPASLSLPPGKATAALALYEGGSKLYSQGKEFWRNHFAYTVTVSEKDPLYMDIHSWLLSIMPNERHRSLLVSSESRRYDEDMSVGSSDDTSGPRRSAKPLTVKFDDSANRKVVIDGYDITVRLHSPEISEAAVLTREPPSSKIYFTAYTYAGQQAVIRELERINSEKSTERKAVLRMVGQWGGWKVRSDLPPRSLESVSLPTQQKARIVDDLAFFLEAEDRYNRLAIPWHRGYMFHGPPGTGKTSIVKALANHFNLDLWYVSLSDLKAESSLLGLLSEVGPRSILLLEDIDTVKITHDRDASEAGTISMGSLLNTLDGVATPHGLVTMMTTNRFEVLDEALTRTGRMDLVEKLDWPTSETMANMFTHFFGRYPNSWGVTNDKPIEGVSPSQVAEIFKQNLDDAEAAESEALQLINTVR
jgi:hypothetical protein